MSNLSRVRCQGWTNPTSIFTGPKIISLSSYYSPSGQTSLVTINGENFYSYSIVTFATFQPTVFFVSSNVLQFYVPSSLGPGIYPVQVINDTILSNIVNYTLDNSSGYWLLGPGNTITNTNNGNIVISKNMQFSDGTIQTTASNRIIGEIKMFAGYGTNNLPENYFWCDGTYLESSSYTLLFNIIGNTYGQLGTKFRLPDLRQKFPIGSKDTTNMNVNYVDTNGTTNTLVTGGNQTMLTNQLGQHTHTFTGDSTTVTATVNSEISLHPLAVNYQNYGNDSGNKNVAHNVNSNVWNGNISVSITPTGNIEDNKYTGTNQEDLLPPFSVVQYIICYK